ncbi:putative phospholipid-binding lipoprotein MlaA precursor [Tsuneonella dongtanensis]|uniref:Putative phospholipid-binding lipoprotein MlaA n=1 Tax=Tsuneonella dongtanensis TaxID=692370 RepID=A0A1B2AAQ8_9SPHN|nr:VacJ family lipoprotein [Tsuneonella dongtanensis]ANY19184.1 putative phospholipid-binding lipoprotein MlaA precursor [Tsuneonella dongtanensis]
MQDAPAAVPAVEAVCDARVLVLPGEAPLGAPCASTVGASGTNAIEGETEPLADEGIVVSGRVPIEADPLVQLNAQTYEAIAAVDEAVIEPIAKAYGEGLPKPARKGLSNFFANLREPVVFLNDVLQLRPKRAMRTLGRFAINSTIGIGGLIDVAKKKPFKLPRRNNGFANTLGYYGVGSGPFLVLPLVGATTLRDVLGGAADNFVVPMAVGKPFTTLEYRVSSYTITSLDSRLENDAEYQRVRASKDPYATARDTYLARRAAEIAALKAPGDGIVKKVAN